MNAGWKAIGLLLIVLLAFGMINARTERIAIWIAVIVAITMVLAKMRNG